MFGIENKWINGAIATEMVIFPAQLGMAARQARERFPYRKDESIIITGVKRTLATVVAAALPGVPTAIEIYGKDKPVEATVVNGVTEEEMRNSINKATSDLAKESVVVDLAATVTDINAKIMAELRAVREQLDGLHSATAPTLETEVRKQRESHTKHSHAK